MTPAGPLKSMVANSRVYEVVRRLRARRALSQWTAHDEEMAKFYAQFVSRDSLCFDVGANVGNRTKIFLRLGAHVVAVEPQDDCVSTLRAAYGSDPHLTIVHSALGESEGQAEMMISAASTISSLSPGWVEAVRASGRFSAYRWDVKRVVPVTTLDKLIDRCGVPAFVKVDVEGFEYQVVRGLSRPVGTLSLEFTPEFIGSTFKCIDHLERIGDIRLNYSTGEAMKLVLADWVKPQDMARILASVEKDGRLFGDVYVRFVGYAGPDGD